MRLPLRRRRAAAPVEAPVGPALTEHKWYRKAAELSDTGMLTMARRLPTLIRQVMRLAWRAGPRDLAATIAFNVAAGVFTAFGLLATTGVLTALFSAGPTPDRVRAAAPELVLVGAAVTVRAAFSAAAQWAQARLRPQVEQIVEQRLYELTTAIELAAFDDAEFQDDLHRARMRGVDSAPSMVDNAVDLFTAAVGVAAAAGALGVLHPVLLPLLLLTALPEGWAAVRAARLGYLTQLDLVEVRRRSWIMSDLMTERRHAAEVRSFTVRAFLLRQYAALAAHVRRVLLDLARRQTMSQVWGDVLKGVATALMYTALGLLLWRGVMPLAVAGTAVLAIRAGQTSLVNLVYALNRCYEDGLYFSDYMAYCQNAEQRVQRSRAGEPGDLERQLAALRGFGEIHAEEVTFAYPDSDKPSLRGVSVRLGRGEIVALVGENGSGKTTLAKILAGLYAPQGGAVRWDDTRVSDLAPEALRRAIAVVAQDHTHWPMTAADNITMGDDLAAADVRANVDEAATNAGADSVIATLPLGLDTLLDKRFANGCELSGGQWQRLAAARGFYRDAPLLICDEPTAALDARAEHHLFDQIRRHAAQHGRTVLLITHRLASVRHADRIYVLDGGRVTEHGTHRELIAQNGLYAELYELQASAYRQGEDADAFAANPGSSSPHGSGYQ
ncbi:ATP-binding cassette subfamily B protein/ATP-binding cassette subfamily C protein [Actinomadura coerulea]|uniref:ATP-binding cassette subfamily B protein/ATP-binding cassette subfamily C protein n=1 Tax=Actinomadura coerulea TaxID=46159 RepID=A0A7X0KZY5_9ACTN|nr:ABC transporter ATP-binding protein [Actinomadura coerulea]MBB6396915.1 ATP-binding cassette subfamily B protein/ATP-binding cassette subfamily C protein [Actinomadura coerulea]GGP95308.1 multidrug ABC transporter permease [Actinomadura coerulea]